MPKKCNSHQPLSWFSFMSQKIYDQYVATKSKKPSHQQTNEGEKKRNQSKQHKYKSLGATVQELLFRGILPTWRISPTPATNSIAKLVEYRLLTNWERKIIHDKFVVHRNADFFFILNLQQHPHESPRNFLVCAHVYDVRIVHHFLNRKLSCNIGMHGSCAFGLARDLRLILVQQSQQQGFS